LYILVELLQKQPAAARRKGVVGKIGNTKPTVARTTQIKPAASHNALVIFHPFFLQFGPSKATLSFIGSCLAQFSQI
jgi:hypothetical protein